MSDPPPPAHQAAEKRCRPAPHMVTTRSLRDFIQGLFLTFANVKVKKLKWWKNKCGDHFLASPTAFLYFHQLSGLLLQLAGQLLWLNNRHQFLFAVIWPGGQWRRCGSRSGQCRSLIGRSDSQWGRCWRPPDEIYPHFGAPGLVAVNQLQEVGPLKNTLLLARLTIYR